jgi:hypothetical protein
MANRIGISVTHPNQGWKVRINPYERTWLQAKDGDTGCQTSILHYNIIPALRVLWPGINEASIRWCDLVLGEVPAASHKIRLRPVTENQACCCDSPRYCPEHDGFAA